MTGDLHHLAAAYVLDALDDDERAEFEAHYPACEICREEVEQFRATSGLLAASAAVDPPPELERRVLEAVARTRQVSPVPTPVASLDARRRRRSPGVAWLASVAAAVMIVAAAVAFVTVRDGTSSVEDVIAAPDAVVTTLAPTTDGQDGTWQVVWSSGRDRVAVIADDLPDPGPDRVYELWAMVGDTPVAAGLFEPDAGTVREATELDDIVAVAWGVTVEPAGGSDAPTTPILFYGER